MTAARGAARGAFHSCFVLTAEFLDVFQCARPRLNYGRPIDHMLKLNFALKNKHCKNEQRQQSGYLIVVWILNRSSKVEIAVFYSSELHRNGDKLLDARIVTQLLIGSLFGTVSLTMRSFSVSG